MKTIDINQLLTYFENEPEISAFIHDDTKRDVIILKPYQLRELLENDNVLIKETKTFYYGINYEYLLSVNNKKYYLGKTFNPNNINVVYTKLG